MYRIELSINPSDMHLYKQSQAHVIVNETIRGTMREAKLCDEGRRAWRDGGNSKQEGTEKRGPKGMQVKIARVKSARRTSLYAWLFIVN